MIELDHRIFSGLYAGEPSSFFFALMVGLTIAGSGWSMIGLVPMLALKRTRRFAAWLAATLLATSLVVVLLKHAIHRARPFAALPGVRALWDAPSDYSCPSGHATGAFCFAAFVAIALVRTSKSRARALAIGALCILIAVGIATSRVYLGVHFPFDVIAGALLGTALGSTGALLYARGVEAK